MVNIRIQKIMIMKKLVISLLISAALLLPVYFARHDLAAFFGSSRQSISYYGSTGQEVRNIQYKLRQWGYYSGSIDGIYGNNTSQSVKLFQSKNGLAIDGVAGPDTLAALGLPAGISGSSSTGGSYVSGDANLLAHLVYGEARGEPYTGKVAVAAVVVNRTQDSRFPHTIAGVIYQPGAFDAVSDGQFNLNPDQSAISAANDALNGWDPTYGCVYYYNPATATSSWIWSRPIIVKIGNHNFAK